MKYTITFLLLLTAAGCAVMDQDMDRHQTPENLAKEQWDACSHYPSVELVTITAGGNLLVRDLHYSSPPVDYLRCIARVGYQQLLSGQRAAKSLVRDAYFVDAKPDREYLYKPSGHFPAQANKFSPEQDVYFFFVIEVPSNAIVRVSFEWSTPLGEKTRTAPRKILTSGAAARKWSFEQLDQTNRSKGRWSVRLFIDEFEAGVYFFNVV
jgi:hypothetical protein